MLCSLVGDADPMFGAALARPHTCTIHNVLTGNRAVFGGNVGHPAVFLINTCCCNTGKQFRTLHAGTLCKRHGHVNGVHPAVVLDIKAGQKVVGPRNRKQVADFSWRYFLYVDSTVTIEYSDPAVLFETIGVGSYFNKPTLAQSGGLSRFLLQP